MLKKRFNEIKQEYLGFCSKDKFFILCAILCVCAISFEYSITRPASLSLFLHYFGASYFPTAWIINVPINFLVILSYNYFLPRIGCVKTFFILSLISVIINLSTCWMIDSFHFLAFIQYLWKDIYILLMYKQVWSIIHTTMTFNRAKYLYGIIFALSGTASMIGGLIPGFLATSLKTTNLFLFTLPIYFLLCIFYLKLYKNSNYDGSLDKSEPLFPGLKNSKYINFILFLVIFMQVSVTFVDYQFNITIEKMITDIDLRTAFMGKILSIVHSLVMVLQLIGGFLILNFLGLKKANYLIPFTLILNAILYIFRPTLFLASYAYIYIKSMDYSIFSIIKETLYLPVKTDEKFKAKAFIDVFVYRFAKAIAASMISFLNFYKLQDYLWIFCISVLVAWIFVIKNIFKENLALEKSKDE